MSKLPFSLSEFQKVDANRDHTVMRSPEGHIIHVAHKALAKEIRDALRQLPIQKLSKGGTVERVAHGCTPEQLEQMGFRKMSDGGFVEKAGKAVGKVVKHVDDSVMQSVGDVSGMLNRFVGQPAAQFAQGVGQGINPEQPGAAPSPAPASIAPELTVAVPEIAPTNTPATAPTSAAPQDPLSKAFQQSQAGMAGEAKIAQQTALNQEKLLGTAIQSMEKQQAESAERQRVINDENAKIIKELQGVDPSSLVNNRSLFGRIASAVGIMAGGGLIVGAINKYLNQEVEVQKANVSKKENLYKMNLQRLGDEQAAANMTKLNMMSLVELQLKQAMQKGVAASAMPGLQKNLGDLALQRADLIQKIEQRQMAMKQAPGPMDVASAERAVRGGTIPAQFQAEAMKEIEYVKGLQGAETDAIDAYAKALGAGVAGAVVGKAVPGGTDSSRRVELANAALERIVRQNRPPGSGVFTDKDAEAQIKPYLVTIGDLANPQAIRDKQRDFITNLRSGYSKTGTLGTHSIKIAPPAGSSFNSTGRKAGK